MGGIRCLGFFLLSLLLRVLWGGAQGAPAQLSTPGEDLPESEGSSPWPPHPVPAHLPKLTRQHYRLWRAAAKAAGFLSLLNHPSNIRLGQTTRVVNDKRGGAETEKDTEIQSEVRAMPVLGKQKQADLGV